MIQNFKKTLIAATAPAVPVERTDTLSFSEELATKDLDHERGNRLCVTVSDIHLTDGTVGLQNLSDETWERFFNSIVESCNENKINELVLVIDGDFIDIIRSSVWANPGDGESPVYPWERERKVEFEKAVQKIIEGIIDQHLYFFSRLQSLDTFIKDLCESVTNTELVVLLGNHDKELMLVNDSLAYFYEHALGKKLTDFSEAERRYIGRMYGDENQFLDSATAPYFPFYYADRGFRFFTTHGQWRDSENSREIKASGGRPGWNVKDGWQPEVWEKLGYAPFLDACFGDSVAAGVLSTFIYKTKKELKGTGDSVKKLTRIVDELDLYRPSYLAPKRMLIETGRMRKNNKDVDLADIIEKNLINCIDAWLSWKFPYQSATTRVRIMLHIAKIKIKFLKLFGQRIELKAIYFLMWALDKLSHYQKTGVDLEKMRTFPGFRPPYGNHGFQIHGEGHTHNPLQEEARLDSGAVAGSGITNVNTNYTYINFGTWRDQIVPRKEEGFRRRGVLRTFNILDLKPDECIKDNIERRFVYLAKDVVIWRDSFDKM